MKSVVQVFVVAIAVFAFVGPTSASDVAPQGSAMDNELNLKRTEFETFAKSKVKQLNLNHKNSRSHMKVTKLKDGTYRARFHQIDDSTMQVKIRRSQSNVAPYVGTISYREKIYESSASDPGKFDPGKFEVVEVIPNRHIFSYGKGGWD